MGVLRQKLIEITITAAILSTLYTVYKCAFTFWQSTRLSLASTGQMEWKNVLFDAFCTICILFIEDAGQPPSSALQ